MSGATVSGDAGESELPTGADNELAGESTVRPVAAEERISSVDVLRGFALLGILLMNIVDFGMPWRGFAAEFLPLTGWRRLDLAFLVVSHVLFEGKMRAIFSMLFGAGVILLTSRAEARGGGISVADVYYRRTLWLIVFGLLHAYLVWSGDILFYYGVAGLTLFPFRHARPAALIAAGLVLLSLLMVEGRFHAREIVQTREKAGAADRAAARGETLTQEQKDAQKEWKDQLEQFRPAEEKVAKSVSDHRAGYLTMLAKRAKAVFRSQSKELYQYGFFDAAGMMLLGMGLMKLGVLSARSGSRVYYAMMALGYGIGIPINAATAYHVWSRGLDPLAFSVLEFWYSPGRLAVALGHVGLVLTVYRAGLFPGLLAALGAVGRMALTNYLATSVVCTFLFEGHGFGLYDRLSRSQLLGIVLAVWAAQLVLSPIWLRHFRYGPAEWLWRTLTYLRRQPLRLARPDSVSIPGLAPSGPSVS